MKWISSLLLMAILSFAACLFLPWWSIAIACFLVALLIPQKHGIAFLTGFIALFILWAGMSYWISMHNDHILAGRMSQIILKKEDPQMIIIITGLIGAFVGGFAALTGSLVRKSVKKQPLHSLS
jgi:uncharacterized membrane protein YeaQ/YmgE (transglycosylase-associated protein family)